MYLKLSKRTKGMQQENMASRNRELEIQRRPFVVMLINIFNHTMSNK